jgi:hypothetical protein
MTHSRSASDQGSQVPIPSNGGTLVEKPSEVLSEDELLNGLVCLYLDIVGLSEEQVSIYVN